MAKIHKCRNGSAKALCGNTPSGRLFYKYLTHNWELVTCEQCARISRRHSVVESKKEQGMLQGSPTKGTDGWNVRIKLTEEEVSKLREGWPEYASERSAKGEVAESEEFVTTKVAGRQVTVKTRSGRRFVKTIKACHRDVFYNMAGDPCIVVTTED